MAYYHGTSDVFQMTEILPPMLTGVLRESWRKKDMHKVYFTDSLYSAQRFARKACAVFGGNPVVYRVQPVGDVWHVNTNEYIADSAKVVDIAC